MGYSEDEAMVRVDFFKESGKRYTTEAVKWTGEYSSGLIHEEFKKALLNHFKSSPMRLSDMDAVCLHPYHQHACPLCIRKGGWVK